MINLFTSLSRVLESFSGVSYFFLDSQFGATCVWGWCFILVGGFCQKQFNAFYTYSGMVIWTSLLMQYQVMVIQTYFSPLQSLVKLQCSSSTFIKFQALSFATYLSPKSQITKEMDIGRNECVQKPGAYLLWWHTYLCDR